jgi:hypothetical protein
MIINQSIGFTFIHIPKSAGTSVTRFLAPLNGPFDLELGGTEFGEEIQQAYSRRYKLRKHSTLEEANYAIEIARPRNEMFVFAFVRNPFSRLSSIYSFLRKWEGYDPDLLRVMKSFQSFEEFVGSELFMRCPGPDGMFRPQYEWLSLNGALAPKVHMFKVECLQNAIETIYDELMERGADITVLTKGFPHSNRSRSQTVDSLDLSTDLVAKIRNFYSEDIRTFGYEDASTDLEF